MQVFGERVRALRVKQAMTQQELGEALGVSAQAVSKWENGIAGPDLALLPRLSSLLRISIDELFGLSGSAGPSSRLSDPRASSVVSSQDAPLPAQDPTVGSERERAGAAEEDTPASAETWMNPIPRPDEDHEDLTGRDSHENHKDPDIDGRRDSHEDPHIHGRRDSHGGGEHGFYGGRHTAMPGPQWRDFRRQVRAAWNRSAWEEFGKHFAEGQANTVDPERVRTAVEQAIRSVDAALANHADSATVRDAIRNAVRSATRDAIQRRSGGSGPVYSRPERPFASRQSPGEGDEAGADANHCPDCNSDYPQGMRHCPGCHENYDPGVQHCPGCHENHDPGVQHCPGCHENHDPGERHCPVCHETYGPDLQHCPVCHENHADGEQHCLVCHETCRKDERHCSDCHENYSDLDVHCRQCHVTYLRGEPHHCFRAS